MINMNGYEIVSEAIDFTQGKITDKFLLDAIKILIPKTDVKLYYYKEPDEYWVAQANAKYRTLEVNESQVNLDKNMNRPMLFVILAHECGHIKVPIVKSQYVLTELNTQLWAIARLIELRVPEPMIAYAIKDLREYWKRPPFPPRYRLASKIADKLKIYDKIKPDHLYWKVVKDKSGQYQLEESESRAIKYNWYHDRLKEERSQRIIMKQNGFKIVSEALSLSIIYDRSKNSIVKFFKELNKKISRSKSPSNLFKRS